MDVAALPEDGSALAEDDGFSALDDGALDDGALDDGPVDDGALDDGPLVPTVVAVEPVARLELLAAELPWDDAWPEEEDGPAPPSLGVDVVDVHDARSRPNEPMTSRMMTHPALELFG